MFSTASGQSSPKVGESFPAASPFSSQQFPPLLLVAESSPPPPPPPRLTWQTWSPGHLPISPLFPPSPFSRQRCWSRARKSVGLGADGPGEKCFTKLLYCRRRSIAPTHGLTIWSKIVVSRNRNVNLLVKGEYGTRLDRRIHFVFLRAMKM